LVRALVLLLAVGGSGCGTLRRSANLVEENQEAVAASTESIRHNHEAVGESSDAIRRNEQAVLTSTGAISENERVVRASTEAIRQNQEAVTAVTSMMEHLSPGQRGLNGLKLAIALLLTALVAGYAALLALVIASLRMCRSLRNIERKLPTVEIGTSLAHSLPPQCSAHVR
jgi:hypothetical protein